jgi:hypothetical protein
MLRCSQVLIQTTSLPRAIAAVRDPFAGRAAFGARLLLLAALAALAGCVSSTTVSQEARTLQAAVEEDHRLAVAVLQAANREVLPYRIENALPGDTFTRRDLFLIDPADLDAWDHILSGLETYCAALSRLTSGQSATDFTAAAEGFAANVQGFGAAVKANAPPHAASAGAAVIEIGTILIQHRAATEAREIARAADPKFQLILHDLIAALGYSGAPPQPAATGLLPTYRLAYDVATAEDRQVNFRGGAIAGFNAMSRDQKQAAIQRFTAWVNAEEAHQQFLGSLDALVAALAKTGEAHAALAHGAPDQLTKVLAELQGQIHATSAIYTQLKGG